MTDPTGELLSTLVSTVALLGQTDEKRWAEWLGKARKLIEGGDFYGVDYLLKAFGGMGSFTDITLADASKNAELQSLQSRLYDIATELRRTRNRDEAS